MTKIFKLFLWISCLAKSDSVLYYHGKLEVLLFFNDVYSYIHKQWVCNEIMKYYITDSLEILWSWSQVWVKAKRYTLSKLLKYVRSLQTVFN